MEFSELTLKWQILAVCGCLFIAGLILTILFIWMCIKDAADVRDERMQYNHPYTDPAYQENLPDYTEDEIRLLTSIQNQMTDV